ncbi:MAG: hypothetical protein J0I30_04905 [Burkholderiales bacterium]|nr:hypothetical protein [Burkholderiales bacterium]
MTAVKKVALTEMDIPELAQDAFRAARRQALRSGKSVLMAKNDQLVQENPDGSRVVLKALKPGRSVIAGSRITLSD